MSQQGWNYGSYGAGRYGQWSYVDGSATVVASASVTAAAQVVANAAAVVSASSVVTASGSRTRTASAAIPASSTITAAGQRFRNVQALITASSTISATAVTAPQALQLLHYSLAVRLLSRPLALRQAAGKLGSALQQSALRAWSRLTARSSGKARREPVLAGQSKQT